MGDTLPSRVRPLHDPFPYLLQSRPVSYHPGSLPSAGHPGSGHGRFRSQAGQGAWTTFAIRLRRFLPEFTKELLEKVNLRAWSRLNPYDDLEACNPTATKPLNVKLPKSFIVKCSHQPADRDKEEDLLRSVQGCIGIPGILIGYEAQQFHTSQNVPEFWPLKFRKNNEDAMNPPDEGTATLISHSTAEAFEVRCHRHLVIETMGHPLDETLSPQKLARALQHAAMGEFLLLPCARQSFLPPIRALCLVHLKVVTSIVMSVMATSLL